MTKRLITLIEVEVNRTEGQAAVVLSLDARSLDQWTLGLCLLKEGLIDSLLVVPTGTKAPIEVELSSGGSRGVRTHVDVRPRRVSVILRNHEIEYLQSFFLKYFRDGIGEVDHLDIEATDGAGGEIYVTFKVPKSKAPLGPEEAAKRLGN